MTTHTWSDIRLPSAGLIEMTSVGASAVGL